MLAGGNGGNPSAAPRGRTPAGSTLRPSTVTASPAVCRCQNAADAGAGIGNAIRQPAQSTQTSQRPIAKRTTGLEQRQWQRFVFMGEMALGGRIHTVGSRRSTSPVSAPGVQVISAKSSRSSASKRRQVDTGLRRMHFHLDAREGAGEADQDVG